MKHDSDRDGKSKTASAVDGEHYPEQHEVKNPESESKALPTRDQIEAKAEQIWRAKGCPEGTAEQDWLQAEAELKNQKNLPDGAQGTARPSGSVQR